MSSNDKNENPPGFDTQILKAETLTEQAKARTEQAEVRADQAEARTEQAKTRTEQAEGRTEQAETRIEQAKTRTEQAETRMEEAEMRTELAETHSEQAEITSIWLAAIVESSDDAIISKNLDGIITSWNRGAEKVFGYSAKEAIGKPMQMLIPPERSGEETEILAQIARGESVDHFETVRVRKDGKLIDVSATISPLKDGGGKIIGASKIARDITERKRAEDVAARLAAVVESSNDAIIGKDLQGIITNWNMGAEKTFGYAASEIVGQPIMRLIPLEHQPQETENMGRIQRGQDVPHFETMRMRKDGKLIPVSVTMSAIRNSAGNVIGVSKVMRDITERKIAEQKIYQLNTELEQRVIERTAQLEVANKELEAFSYSVSHDLRAPLRAINGFAGIVLEDFSAQLPEEGKRYLERIRKGGERMGELIDDLLAFSRLSRQSVNRQPVNSAKIVQDALDELKPQLDGHQVEIKVGELPACHGDPALLKQVWVNLISNGIKYTRGRESAIVEIGCEPKNNESVFFVRDNGAGFDMKYADKLFGVFQRLHRADEFEGTGVGLAIVQRIIHRHGGRVWAEAKVNEGAIFYFTIEGETKL